MDVYGRIMKIYENIWEYMFGNMANMNANGTMYAPGQGSQWPVTISLKMALDTFAKISQKLDQISESPDQRKYRGLP